MFPALYAIALWGRLLPSRWQVILGLLPINFDLSCNLLLYINHIIFPYSLEVDTHLQIVLYPIFIRVLCSRRCAMNSMMNNVCVSILGILSAQLYALFSKFLNASLTFLTLQKLSTTWKYGLHCSISCAG